MVTNDMREWRNWQTRTFEGRVVYTVRVQVPSLAPKKPNGKFGFLFFKMHRSFGKKRTVLWAFSVGYNIPLKTLLREKYNNSISSIRGSAQIYRRINEG